MTKKKLAESRGYSEESDFRYFLTDREIKILDSIEDLTARTIDADDMEPVDAVQHAVSSMRAVAMFCG
ncbi:MAG: hypothetical protein GDA56_21975 [Hormoscilla sp. GM7CHS1pb]|nr:hypothetical protein [Hormoscilla sp. GM7CHS1pb]